MKVALLTLAQTLHVAASCEWQEEEGGDQQVPTGRRDERGDVAVRQLQGAAQLQLRPKPALGRRADEDEVLQVPAAVRRHRPSRAPLPLAGLTLGRAARPVVWSERQSKDAAGDGVLRRRHFLRAARAVDWGGLMAASTLMSVPVVLAAVFGQRYLFAGLTAGATKACT
jgi:hypothetical protein